MISTRLTIRLPIFWGPNLKINTSYLLQIFWVLSKMPSEIRYVRISFYQATRELCFLRAHQKTSHLSPGWEVLSLKKCTDWNKIRNQIFLRKRSRLSIKTSIRIRSLKSWVDKNNCWKTKKDNWITQSEAYHSEWQHLKRANKNFS
jgi:hypothetical protein